MQDANSVSPSQFCNAQSILYRTVNSVLHNSISHNSISHVDLNLRQTNFLQGCGYMTPWLLPQKLNSESIPLDVCRIAPSTSARRRECRGILKDLVALTSWLYRGIYCKRDWIT